MNPVVLGLNLALCFSGLAALALSLDRHHRDAFLRRVPPGRARSLRAAGWAGIGLSLAAAIALEGWNFGPVQWIGALTGGALLVVAFLSYRPGWLRPAALAALPLALLALPLALKG
ncbi:DUF3325 domain-containing protein [Methylobacterium trifolii]|uniref:DUF3325 domain-containing protein n=1 Tax=Methylobacterium trifolii TaxID=1003092 RepID=A0ABQ4U2I8_9HYPH|nr:DUF3325 domain-containing protein [Methylobacterium trifolii]GJE61666.1 hypothetical protein MPOCJGCO_3789 [Methylobacterium trifolii]